MYQFVYLLSECSYTKQEAKTPYRVVKDGPIWRLVFNAVEEGMEEVVASVQGILCRAELPPFEDKIASALKFFSM